MEMCEGQEDEKGRGCMKENFFNEKLESGMRIKNGNSCVCSQNFNIFWILLIY